MNGECRYEQDPDDTAIRVCVVHAPDLGLYGDEVCAGPIPVPRGDPEHPHGYWEAGDYP